MTLGELIHAHRVFREREPFEDRHLIPVVVRLSDGSIVDTGTASVAPNPKTGEPSLIVEVRRTA